MTEEQNSENDYLPEFQLKTHSVGISQSNNPPSNVMHFSEKEYHGEFSQKDFFNKEPDNFSERKGAILRKSTLVIESKLANDFLIQVRHGDITQEDVDVVVNAANNHLLHGGGVAGAILNAGGYQIQIESDNWVRTHGYVPNGHVAVTGPGKMRCKYIIHAVGPVSSGNLQKERKELVLCIWNSLRMADRLKLKSISLPAISSGIFGFPKDECASVSFDTAIKFCKAHPRSTLKEIRFTNFDLPTVLIFTEEFKRREILSSNLSIK